jgi:hypothetical protein
VVWAGHYKFQHSSKPSTLCVMQFDSFIHQ